MRFKQFSQRFLARATAIRRTQWVLIAIFLVATLVVGTLFHPAIQKRLVIKYVAPSFEKFSVERIHLLPWSLSGTELVLDIGGAKVSAAQLSARFCLSSLLWKTLDLNSISVRDAIIDLRSFVPADPEPIEPFAGIFTLLDHGFGMRLGDVHVSAFALLSATDRVRVKISGGQVEPHKIGALSFTSEIEMNDGESVHVDGQLEVDQLSNGHFNAISLTTNATVDLKSLPHPELIHLRAIVKPTAQPPQREIESASGELHFEPQPESVELSVAVGTENQTALNISALYDGRVGDLTGNYRLETDDKFLAPYMGGAAIPVFEHSAGGALEVNLVDLRGQLSLVSRTDFTNVRRLLLDNPKAPKSLSLIQEVGLTFTDEQITIGKVHAEIEDASTTEMLTTGLLQPVVIPFADPSAVLDQAATFLTLTIAAVQLEWLDFFVADYGVMSGTVSGSFAVKSDGDGRLIVESSETTVIDNIRIDSGDAPIFEALRIELKPLIQANSLHSSIALNDIFISLAEQSIATLNVSAILPSAQEGDSNVRFALAGTVEIDPIIADPRIQSHLADFDVPADLTFNFDADLTQHDKSLQIHALNASLGQAGKKKLIDVRSTQEINLPLVTGDQHFVQPVGELASISVNGFDLGWISPLAKPLSIRGEIRHASFTLTSGAGNKLLLAPMKPLDVRRVGIDDDKSRLLNNIWLSIRPTISYSPDAIDVDYRGLRVSAGKNRIASGNGAVRVKSQKEQPVVLRAKGDLSLNLANFASQPALADALSDMAIDSSLGGKLRYNLQYTGGSVQIDSLNFDFLHDDTSYIQIEVADGLTLKPMLAQGENFAQYATGAFELSIKELGSTVLNDIVPLDNLTFDTINGVLNLESDGERLFARIAEPITVKQIKFANADGEPLLDPFEFRTSGTIELNQQTINTSLERLAVQFHASPTPALSGQLSATIEPLQTIPLQKLDAEINGALAQLLNQPAVMPQHSLTQGTITATITVDPQGNISANTRIKNLVASKPLAIHTITMPLTGNMRPDGNGFDFTMPLTGIGNSGSSEALTVGDYLPQPDKPTQLRLTTTSPVFYLNDILATIDSISPTQPDNVSESDAQSGPVILDEAADKNAFWDVLPYDTRFSFEFDRVFYSEYVALTEIAGQANLRDEVLELINFAAYFHESPITINGGLSFSPEQPNPYDADVVGKIEDFDLNQFFSELLPTKKSRIEGLFGVDIKIGGNSPNAAQFRNQLLLDLSMNSRDGLFRPLPLDSVLMIGASDALGFVGEGLSYLPTGGFGAGAVSRLVNYIAEIDYDSVDIRIKRDTSLDLVIERVEMLSPDIRIAATGTIEHADGKDIVDSPMDLEASLNMTGKGAAILYSLNLLRDEQDKFDYWKGPEIKITGSAAAPESNFAEIIQRASDATIKGGITRPISGLIGNVKHRWFGSDAKIDNAKQEIIEADSVENLSQ
ncbi:MAG: hypothetical protein ACI9BW_000076 [Gammaproteobacteria bacterium]|jgi:hypothetical protein